MTTARKLISLSVNLTQGDFTGKAEVGGDVTIVLDPKNIEQCRGIAKLILSITMYFHGIEVADSIMRQAAPTRRQIQEYKNFILLHAAEGMSAERAAAKLAEQNNSLPKDQRYGRGSTSVSTLERQIRRLRKKGKR